MDQDKVDDCAWKRTILSDYSLNEAVDKIMDAMENLNEDEKLEALFLVRRNIVRSLGGKL